MMDDLPADMRAEISAMGALDDEALWRVAEARLSPEKQRRYSRLLRRAGEGSLTARDEEALEALGDEARRLTLRKAQAYVLLKWRGYRIPTREELERTA